MSLIWRLQDIPELKELSRAERTEVWAATGSKRFRDPVMMTLLVPYFLVVAIGNYLGGQWLPWRYGWAIGGGIGVAIGMAFYVTVSYNRCRPYLVEEVHNRARRQQSEQQ